MQLRKGRYVARAAADVADLLRAQALRGLCFGLPKGTPDQDSFDGLCTHVLIEDIQSGDLICCFRMLQLSPTAIEQSYSAQFYDLSALGQFSGPLLEMGRFCIHPNHLDPDILRIAWAFMTRWVDEQDIKLLFGCASFQGVAVTPHLDAFHQLFTRHQAPASWRPGVKAPEIFDFATGLAGHMPDVASGLKAMPPLLRTYLLMGGWVSDHAVLDHALNTVHVFTGVEIGAVPPKRAQLLRALADAG